MMEFMWDTCKRPDLARQTMGNLNLVQRDDEFKVRMAWWFWFGARQDAEGFLRVIEMVKDEDRRDFELLKFYANPHLRADPVVLATKALPLANRLTRVDTYAVQAWSYKANVLTALKRWAEVLQALRNFPNPGADVFFRIADCHVALGDIEAAVTQLRQIENFFPAENANAVLRIAKVYRKADQRAKEITVLHEIMARYKKTQASSQAHERLEALGVPIRGGDDVKVD
jgi:tetratricopeptide (TPR) repeat protein